MKRAGDKVTLSHLKLPATLLSWGWNSLHWKRRNCNTLLKQFWNIFSILSKIQYYQRFLFNYLLGANLVKFCFENEASHHSGWISCSLWLKCICIKWDARAIWSCDWINSLWIDYNLETCSVASAREMSQVEGCGLEWQSKMSPTMGSCRQSPHNCLKWQSHSLKRSAFPSFSVKLVCDCNYKCPYWYWRIWLLWLGGHEVFVVIGKGCSITSGIVSRDGSQSLCCSQALFQLLVIQGLI